ncbi:NADP-dependent oxidoreductase [Hazenella coriacea]|uniref:Enoyl reductase (ER) domain-containing protein n=1 Tax=Hazenella coriacea TaxID=1179467 RepID=A0A4R3LE48_9BACL|nr:NADP-dependent oxidoreductase [Hazenella coriacea]TCS96604.1 hypothetical protein EDD58_101240 [Hazenella coriacea]
MKNRQILLTSRPKGMPDESNFQLIETPIPSLQNHEVLIQTLYLSVDPYMRGRMNDSKSYIPPFQLNEVLTGGVVGKVVESEHPDFIEGDFVLGTLGWADYSICHGDQLTRLDPQQAPLTTALSVVGMPGLTAYFGLLDIGKPKTGETVVISGAAGAVGSIVGQIAKLNGCHVVGIAGSEAKIAYLKNELGFDAVINYKTCTDLNQAIQETCPNGVDIYFDNVGGGITDAVLRHINKHARIPLCGQIASYNAEKPELGPRNFSLLLINSALVQGFIVSDYASRFGEALKQLSIWLHEGKIKYRENIVDGLENAPQAFLGLFRGDNIGKQLVKVAD